MNKKDLLIVFNIFGIHREQEKQIEEYIESLKTIFWHIDRAQDCSVRIAIGANLVSDLCVQKLKDAFQERITIFKLNERYTCQISTNKVILEAITHFEEEYEGYFYISSGLYFPELENWNIFDRIMERLKTGRYGIIQMQANSDNGYHFLGEGPIDWMNDIDFLKDYIIPPGNHANFHAAIVHKRFKEFYNKPITDVHGKCGMESVLSYCCAALGMNYLLLGDSCLHHKRSSDAYGAVNLEPGRWPEIPCHTQMFNRDKTAIARDPLALEVGIGYYPGELANNEVDWNGVILPHQPEAYDENYFARDERMKDVAKHYFFSDKRELNYESLQVEIL